MSIVLSTRDIIIYIFKALYDAERVTYNKKCIPISNHKIFIICLKN